MALTRCSVAMVESCGREVDPPPALPLSRAATHEYDSNTIRHRVSQALGMIRSNNGG